MAQNNKFVGAHTFKSSNDYNPMEPKILFGQTREQVADMINTNVLMENLRPRQNDILNEILEHLSAGHPNTNDVKQLIAEHQSVELTVNKIIASKFLSDLVTDSMLEMELIEGTANITEIVF